MMNKVSIFAFIFGAAIGSLVTWRLVKDKYAQIADAEIAEMEEYYSNKYAEKENTDEESPEPIKKAENITIFDGYSLKEIKGDNKVNSIVINKDNENKELEVSAIFPLFEQISSSSFLSPLSIKMSNGFIDADKDGKTNVDGVYAVGDIVNKKLRQLINAASEGALAAISSINYVRSKK